MNRSPQTPTAGAGRLHKALSPFGVLLLTLSCLSPVFSVYGVGADVLQHAGTGAAALFAAGMAVALVWAAVYAELGSAYPYAGGDYVGVGRVLGPWAGIATLAIWTATSGPSIAFEAKVFATYAGELAPGWPAPGVAFAALAAAVGVALLAVRAGALITGLFLAVEMVAVLVLIFAGFSHPARGLAAFAAQPLAWTPAGVLAPVSFAALAAAGVNAAYGTVGGNQALYFGEELGDPHRRMGGVVITACLAGAAATALPVMAVVFGARDMPALLKSPAPLAAFVSQALAPWAGRALSAGVALAVFNAMIAQVMMCARLVFSLGRDQLFPRALSRLVAGVHQASGAPRGATLAVAAYAALSCLLSSHLLLVFLNGLLVYSWSLVCLAVLVGRGRGLTARPGYWRAPLHPLAPVLGLLLAAAFTVSDLADADAGRPSLIVMGLIVAAALAWRRLALAKRPGGWTPSLGDLG